MGSAGFFAASGPSTPIPRRVWQDHGVRSWPNIQAGNTRSASGVAKQGLGSAEDPAHQPDLQIPAEPIAGAGGSQFAQSPAEELGAMQRDVAVQQGRLSKSVPSKILRVTGLGIHVHL